MTNNFQPSSTLSPFLKTSQFFPQDDEQFKVVLTQMYKDIANNNNIREIATYDIQESVTGQQFFSPGTNQQKRQTFRQVVPFPSPLVAGINDVNLSVFADPSFFFTSIYGTVKGPTGTLWAPIPQGGANTSSLEIITGGAVTFARVIPAAGYVGYTCQVVVEYLKN